MGRFGPWAKWGCIGCGGIVAVLVLIGAVFAAIGWTAARNVTPTDLDLDLRTPRAAEEAAPAPPVEPDAEAAPAGAVAGVVTLDLADGGFTVVPAEPGAPLRIEGTYDQDGYTLTHDTEDGPPWRTTIRFGSSRTGLVAMMAGLFGAPSPELRILLPRDVRLDLVVAVRTGALESMEIGGLDVNSLDLSVEKGAVEFSVSEPQRHPAESISISGAMFGGVTRSVGNASPGELTFAARMGGLVVDLQGAWRRDAVVNISSSMSGVQVVLPTDVRIEGIDDPRFALPDETELARPTLRIRTDGSEKKGGIEFQR